jgi:putative two-component system hydrogenase maturation factor HypX/HoxX
MLALGPDRVVLRAAAVLNPHYASMGLYGSEYWTYVLPRRVGAHQARLLTEQCEPVNALASVRLGLADTIVPGDRSRFTEGVLDYAETLAADPGLPGLLAERLARREAEEHRLPLETYRVRELAEMSRDIFEDRCGFAAARRDFLAKRPSRAPHLPEPRRPADRPGPPPRRWSPFRRSLTRS